MRLITTALLLMVTNTVADGETIVALTNPNQSGDPQRLYTFDSAGPLNLGTTVNISGLGSGESLLGIDYRPLTGQLFGLSDGNAIYTLNPTTGAATQVGGGFTTPLSGTSYGFDFNPVIDKIRIVGDDNQNIVANPDNGMANIATTTPVFYATGDVNDGADPNVVHHAYDGNVPGTLASATQLRAIDTELDILVKQANNAGTLETVGSLGIDAIDVGGFDVSTVQNNAFAAFADVNGGTQSSFYSINLFTGEATRLGTIGQPIVGLAVVPVPEPSTWMLGTLVIGVAIACRRRL